MLPHCHEPSSHIYKIEDIEIDQKGQQHGIRTTLLLLSSIADIANQSQFTFHWSRVQLHKPYHSTAYTVTHQSLTIARQTVVFLFLCRVGRREEITVGQLLFLKTLPALAGSHQRGHDDIANNPLRWPWCGKVIEPFWFLATLRWQSSEWAETLRELARDRILSEAPLAGHHQDLVGKGAAALFLGTIPKTLRYLLDCGNFFLVVRTPVSGSPDSCLHLDFFGLVSCSGKGNWGMTFPGRSTIRWNKATDFIDSF